MFKDSVKFYIDANLKLTEGISFFKNSGKIEKLARKIKVKASLINDAKAKEELTSFCANLLKIAPQFRNLESEYEETTDKYEKRMIKEKYKFLEIKYHELMKSIDRESFYKAVKIANVSILIAGIVGVLIFNLLGNKEPTYHQDPSFLPRLKQVIASLMNKEPSQVLQDTHNFLTNI